MLQHQSPAELRPSRVVVLGASGFVAQELIHLLRDDGTPCRPVGSVEVDLVDCSAAEKLKKLIQATDSVVVLSALTPDKGRDRATFFKNTAMIDHVCHVVSNLRCRHVVYISSDSVYASPPGREIDEASCCESNDMYALSHIVREKLLLDACRSADVALAIIRPTAIYGPGDTHNSYGPNRFMRSALRDGKITLFGEGEEERDHLYIDDLCRLILMCLSQQSAGVLNAANGTELSFRDVALNIREELGGEVVIETAPRLIPIVHRRFNTAALKTAFPEFSPTPFQTGVRQTLEKMAGKASE